MRPCSFSSGASWRRTTGASQSSRCTSPCSNRACPCTARCAARSPASDPPASSSTPDGTSHGTATDPRNVSASSSACPCASRQSALSRRRLRDSARDARPGIPDTSGSTRNRVFPIRCRRRNRTERCHPSQRSRGLHLNAPDCQPSSATQWPCPLRHMPQPASRELLEPQVVVLRHQPVPAPALFRALPVNHLPDNVKKPWASGCGRPFAATHAEFHHRVRTCPRSAERAPETALHTSFGRCPTNGLPG